MLKDDGSFSCRNSDGQTEQLCQGLRVMAQKQVRGKQECPTKVLYLSKTETNLTEMNPHK